MADPSTTEPIYAETATPVDRRAELAQARRLAARYEMEFVDLEHFNIDHALFRSIPADLDRKSVV